MRILRGPSSTASERVITSTAPLVPLYTAPAAGGVFDAIELMFRIEEEFDLSIPDDDMQGFVKVGDVIDYLQRRLSGEPGAPAPKAAATPPAAAPPPPVFKTAAAAQRVTPAPKAAAKKAKPKAARRRA